MERDSTLGRGFAAFEVGESKTLPVAPGDKLLLQGNRTRQFINGELVEVKSVHGGSIVLTDDRVIPLDYNTFTHGYAVTSHAAQGKTVDAVFVVASARSMPAVHRAQFYVSISRGRDECRVFTDDKELLRAHVTDSSARLAASHYMDGLLEANHEANAPPERLVRRFTTGEVRVVGSGLERIEDRLSAGHLRGLKTVEPRYASALTSGPIISSITVNRKHEI